MNIIYEVSISCINPIEYRDKTKFKYVVSESDKNGLMSRLHTQDLSAAKKELNRLLKVRREQEIWEFQLALWPDSKKLSTQDVNKWIAESSDYYQRHRRQQIVNRSRRLNAVFYTCGDKQKYRGARYGIEGNEYLFFNNL